MTGQNTVLLLTHSQDHFTVDRVADGLVKRGARPIRFNTDRFPLEVHLINERIASKSRLAWSDGQTSVEGNEIRAVWCRRIWSPTFDEHLDARFVEMCRRESFAALSAWFDGLHEVRWINDPVCEQAAQNKLRQLRLAAQIGLETPRTVLTNDPVRVRFFFEETGGRMITKLLRPLGYSMAKAETAMRTSLVRVEDLAELDHLRHCPMVFQELVPRQYDLRIACVNGRTFVGAIDARATVDGAVDWRRATPEECSWQHDELPQLVQDKLAELMQQLGLAFGAVDMILTPDGRYVFLEVNPSGEWGMLERDLGLAIADSIAEALLA